MYLKKLIPPSPEKLPSLIALALFLLGALGCNGEPISWKRAGPTKATACNTVELTSVATGDVASQGWNSVNYPLVFIERHDDVLRFQAPAVARLETIQIVHWARDSKGKLHQAEHYVEVSPADNLPSNISDGMAPDCQPFIFGIASGDPKPTSVILWTALDPSIPSSSTTLQWELATDKGFTQIIATGETTASEQNGQTAQALVTELTPATTYYYRFKDNTGNYSRMGRTKTAPNMNAENLRFAVASCSSIYSGYFNAYRRISERNDLDLVLHLGDYIYDFVDEDEEVRVPTPYPQVPVGLDGWRERHRYYLQDPDLRLARAAHPWIVMWDNHDLDTQNVARFNQSVQAFREWVPMQAAPENRSGLAYRRFQYGSLVDLFMLDVLTHRNQDLIPGTTTPSILGNSQFDWLENHLAESTARWRVLASQKVMGTVKVNPIYAEGRSVFDLGTWDGFPASRTRLFDMIKRLGLNNQVVISGDSHVTIALDLVDNPDDPANLYDPTTNNRSIGVEILPTSISRGNFDETLGDLVDLLDVIVPDTYERNPHHRSLELTKHGYGLLDFTSEKLTAEMWYSPILEVSETEFLGLRLTSDIDTNQWNRD